MDIKEICYYKIVEINLEKKLRRIINDEMRQLLHYYESLDVQSVDMLMPPSETILFEWFKKFNMLNVLCIQTLNLYNRPPTNDEIEEMFDMINKKRNEIISKITFPYLKAGWIRPSLFTLICSKCHHLNHKKAKYCCNCGEKLSHLKDK